MEKDTKTQELTVANNDVIDVLKDQYGIETAPFDHELDVVRKESMLSIIYIQRKLNTMFTLLIQTICIKYSHM